MRKPPLHLPKQHAKIKRLYTVYVALTSRKLKHSDSRFSTVEVTGLKVSNMLNQQAFFHVFVVIITVGDVVICETLF